MICACFFYFISRKTANELQKRCYLAPKTRFIYQKMENLSQEELNEVLIEIRFNGGSHDPLFSCEERGETNGTENSTSIH